MLKNYKLLFAFVLLFCTQLSADTWIKTFGGNSTDWGTSVQQTQDGGFIITGLTASFGAGNNDIYFIKTNSLGDTLWTKTYGRTGDDGGYSVQQIQDSGFIIAGWTESFGAGYSDVCLIRINSSGGTLWTKTFGGTDEDEGYSVQQTQDSGFIIAGRTYSFGSGIPIESNVYLIKTNSSGDTVWTKAYGGTGYDLGISVQQTQDDGFIIAGYTNSFGAGDFDVYLIKTNFSGDTLWTKTFGGTGYYDDGWSVQQTSDSGFIIAGVTSSFGAGGHDVYLIRTNSLGNTLWTKTFGGTSDDCGYSVRQTKDGGFIITGYTYSFGAGSDDVYLIRTDSSGDTLWTKTFGGTGTDCGYSVRQTEDGGFIIAGYTNSFGAGFEDIYLIKTDSLGYVGVEEQSNIKTPSTTLRASPNLFTNQTVLTYQIPATSKVSLALYDITGSCVKTLVNELKPAGTYSLNLNSNGLKTGVYFCKMQAGDFKTTIKLTLLK